jgi:short-subunit dehydrogenase
MNEKSVLITGVSSGLGRKTAEYLGLRGYKVFGTVRKTGEPIANVQLLEMDVTYPDSVKRGIEKIIQSGSGIDILINNAGMGIAGSLEDSSAEEIALQMNANFIGTVNTIQAVLPVMRRAGHGLIINISSIGGLMGLPFQSVYSASKFAVEGLSEGLRMELKAFNIKVVVIEPGDFNTSFTAKRKIVIASDKSAYKSHFIRSLAAIEKDEKAGKSPEYMARSLYKIIRKRNPRHHYIISSFEQKLAVFLKIVLPGKIFRRILESHYSVK